jgi:hypothetical protein
VRTFLSSWQPRGPDLRLAWTDVRAFMRSLWMLGVLRRGRFGFWRLLCATLFASPQKFRAAMELAIMGYHFRTVAERL